MTLTMAVAKDILQGRLGLPVKDIAYVAGFSTPDGRVVALRPDQKAVNLWYQLPAAPDLPGVQPVAHAKNDSLTGPMAVLNDPSSPRVQFADSGALHRFLDWYLGLAAETGAQPAAVNGAAFRLAYGRFQSLVVSESGQPFRTFHDGLVKEWENYKPGLRKRALELLEPETWTRQEIGDGSILRRMISAIEIQESSELTNNLVYWQNRYGPSKQVHRALLDAVPSRALRQPIESALFGLYRGGANEGSAFAELSELTGGKYPLLAYLFFLKDMQRFVSIHPSGFDRAFAALGIDLTTARNCNWDNYQTFNATLSALRPHIGAAAGLTNIRLIDAHSFCWVFSALMKREEEGKLTYLSKHGKPDPEMIDWSGSVKAMVDSAAATAMNANGQTVEQVVKNKELRLTKTELGRLLDEMIAMQNFRCALTGIPLQPRGAGADPALVPSLDRIRSDGHYEEGNVQVVCQFANFWKGSGEDAEFRRLLQIVRSYHIL